MVETYTARCGRTDSHHAHLYVRTDGPLIGRTAPCVGNDSPRIVGIPAPERTQNVSRETMPEWVRRAQSGRMVAKDMTRA